MGIKSKSGKRFQILINVIMIIMSLAAVLPIILLFTSSITDESTLVLEGYSFFPKKFSLGAYEYLMHKGEDIFRAYGITLLITVVGTIVSLIITPLLAYPISRRDFKARNGFAFFVFFTMLFNGGIVPSYIMWTQIFHQKNNILALIIPGLLMNAFNVILVKNYFAQNIPMELIEAARMDGAGEFKIFFKIVLQLSLPIMATIGLFVGIAYWNDWTNGLYYITNTKLYSLQNLLNRILQDVQFLASNSTVAQSGAIVEMPTVGVRMAISVIGVVPILVLYPFFQKYFVKGITIGAVKG